MNRYTDLLNISPPERVVFRFPGKLGRIYLIWEEGEWIITNRRLIFIGNKFSSSNHKLFSRHFGRRLVFIILLEEIEEIIKKKTKVIIRYLPAPELNQTSMKELAIGFLKKNIRRNEVGHFSDQINAIYDFLTELHYSRNINFCPNCGSNLEESVNYCPHCGISIKKCTICNFQVENPDEAIQCPDCHRYFHRREFIEWIKVYGRCPGCNSKMNDFDVLYSEIALSR